MAEQFYDGRTRKKVSIPEKRLKKTKYERTTRSGSVKVRYALRGELPDGRTLFKFVKKEIWDRYNVPEE